MPSREEVAGQIAESHYAIEPGIARIYRILASDDSENGSDEPVKLLEVNPAAFPCGVRPLYFRPDVPSGIVYPLVIVEITPEEFEGLGTVLRLPEGWIVGEPIARSIPSATSIS